MNPVTCLRFGVATCLSMGITAIAQKKEWDILRWTTKSHAATFTLVTSVAAYSFSKVYPCPKDRRPLTYKIIWHAAVGGAIFLISHIAERVNLTPSRLTPLAVITYLGISILADCAEATYETYQRKHNPPHF